MMVRSLLLGFAVTGVTMMIVSPAEAYGERRAEMLPPTNNLGGKSYVRCWYHVGACPPYGGYYGGNAIDWAIEAYDTGDHNVWQRFHVWPQDPNYNVTTQLSANYEDGLGCDYYRLWVWGYKNGSYTYEGYVDFKHANTSWPGAYTVEYPGRIANWLDGTQTYDSNCPWTGYHVHEASSGEDWLNPAFDYYSSTICVPGSPTVRHCTNNNLSNVTRAFIW